MSKILVIYHSADYDGIFCREIARKFLPTNTEFWGWDFGDDVHAIEALSSYDMVYILDLPCDRPFGVNIHDPEIEATFRRKVIWIDHHKTAIESHPSDIPGYRIEGVAACRLAYQFFALSEHNAQNQTNEQLQVPLPEKQDFIDRNVVEPEAVMLAGEHDIWDHRDPRTILFQLGLSSKILTSEDWKWMLSAREECKTELDFNKRNVIIMEIVSNGRVIQPFLRNADELKMKNAFMLLFEDTTFLAINSISKGSLQFGPLDTPDSRHDALLKFHFNGRAWEVSMYHSAHRKDVDLSVIAKKHGGGGHPGACGFVCKNLPFHF